MPTFNHTTANHVTVNLDVARQGWNNGTVITIDSPLPTSWSDIAGDNAEIAEQNWNHAAVLSGTLLVKNETSGKVLYERSLSSVYATFLGFPMRFYDEVSYGDVAQYTVSGVTVAFDFNGVIPAISASINESIYYRQIEDTESWGSEHAKSLFIPRQNPVP